MSDLIEMRIISAVRELLTGKVNELLGDMEFYIPLVEFGDYTGSDVVVPVIALVSCERSEKERLIFQDAYFLTITFNIPESEDTELKCFTYAAAVGDALKMNSTLSGIADRVVITGKKYNKPKKENCGENWEMVLTFRITVEGMNNVS